METANRIKERLSEESLVNEAQSLALVLRNSPQFQVFMQAYQVLQTDQKVSELTEQIDELQIKVGGIYDDQKELVKEMDGLMRQLEDLSVVKNYYEQEDLFCDYLAQVDQVISREAGISFSLNARRSRCSCNS